MRFLFGVLVGYNLRGRNKILITVLATVLLIDYIVVPAGAHFGLSVWTYNVSANQDQHRPEFQQSKD
jgi:hypothetical protein